MNNISTSLSGIMNNFSITGHPYLDTLILSSLIPIAIGYINSIYTAFKSFAVQLVMVIWKYVRMLIKTRTVGNLLCKVKLEQENDMFSIIKNTIFDKLVESDIPNESIFNFLTTYDDVLEQNEDSTNTNYIDDWYKRQYEMDRTLNIQKDYMNDKFINSTFSFGYDNIERKFFRYKDFLLKFSMKTLKDNTKQIIYIEILSFKSFGVKKEDAKQYISILEDFLKEKFDILDKIYYVYKLIITHNGFNDCISNIISQNGYVNTRTGLLKFGDNYNNDNIVQNINESKYSTNNMVVDLKIENISDSKKDIIDEYDLYDNTKNNRVDTSMSFTSLYLRYVSTTLPSYSTYGYFIKDRDIYFLHHHAIWTIEIVSFGKRLTDADIKDRLDMIRKLSNQQISASPKIKNPVVIYKRIDKSWANYKLDPRSFDTIYLPDSIMNEVKSEIDKFLTYEKLYAEFQIPYKKGLLFYGPPGTGKTSLVKALAYEYQMKIYLVNINDDEVNDDTIVNILNSLAGGNKILLFEDIDTAFADKEQVKMEVKHEVIPELDKPNLFNRA